MKTINTTILFFFLFSTGLFCCQTCCAGVFFDFEQFQFSQSFYYREFESETGFFDFLAEESDDRLSPQMKSILIPGWGQLSQEEHIKGTFFLTVALSTCGFGYYYNNEANHWYNKYQDATTVEEIERFRDRTEIADIRRNQAVLAFALNYIINVIDIYLDFGHSSDKPTFMLIINGENNGIPGRCNESILFVNFDLFSFFK